MIITWSLYLDNENFFGFTDVNIQIFFNQAIDIYSIVSKIFLFIKKQGIREPTQSLKIHTLNGIKTLNKSQSNLS